MTTDVDPEYTSENPDLQGFDLAAMAGLGAYPDRSGGGVKGLAWEMKCLRETQERIDRLRSFVSRYQLILARLAWSLHVTRCHPLKKDGPFVAEIELFSHVYDRRSVKPQDIAALWPDAEWSRAMPCYGIDADRVRDYVAEVDGVSLRIKKAEYLPPSPPADRFGPCGRVRISKAK